MRGVLALSVKPCRACQLSQRESPWQCGKVSGSSAKFAGVSAPPGGAVAQRLRGFKSAEPEKTVKRSSRRTGVNLQFFPVEPTSLGLKGASSPFFVAPARRNRWHFSGSLLVSKENIPRQAETSLAETILNRPTQKAAAAPKVRRLLCLCQVISPSGKPAGACPPCATGDTRRWRQIPHRRQSLAQFPPSPAPRR